MATDASHFSYGVIRWEFPPDYFYTKEIIVHFEGTYRISFTSAYRGYKINQFASLSSAGSLSYIGSNAGGSTNIGSLKFNVTEKFDSLDWFGGKAAYRKKVTANIFEIRYNLCCRISQLKDGNRDKSSDMYAKVNTVDFSASPIVRSVNRIYLGRYQPVSSHPLGLVIKGFTISNQKIRFYVPPTGKSSLPTTIPCGNSSATTCRVDASRAFTMTDNGIINWTPSETGPYAFQSWLVEYKGTFPSSITQFTNYAVIDLLFEVTTQTCTSISVCYSGSNYAPVFRLLQDTFDFRTGLTTSYPIEVYDENENDTLTTTAIYLPDGAELVSTGKDKKIRKYVLRWNPNVDQTMSISCFFSFDQHFAHAHGNNCSYLNVIVLDYIFVNGLVRDFKESHQDFNVAANYGATAPNWVAKDLADNKPVFVANSHAQTPKKFNEWFNDVSGVNLSLINTITLSDKKNLPLRKKRVFSLLSNDFFPIDGKLYNEGLLGRNHFFTYELHTYFTYLGGATDKYNFKSNGDMWIFVENRLAETASAPQKMHGQGYSAYVLDMVAIKGNYSPPLEANGSYKIDIFFAQRAPDIDPIFHIEFAESSHCNALNAVNASDVFSDSKITIPMKSTSSTDLILNGYASLNSGGVKIISQTPSESGSVWYVSKQKVMSGFQSNFTFTVGGADANGNNGPEGFAFVIQNHDSTARGPGGSNLGYASLRNSVAVEFDFLTSSARSDPEHQHISVHTAYTNQNSATEASQYYPSGSTYSPADPNLPFRFNNASAHDVRIELSPAEDVTWLTVFVNANIRPVFEAQLDTKELYNMFGDGAYVGFTASTSVVAKANHHVTIDKWSVLVVPPIAHRTTYESYTRSSVAGVPNTIEVQLRDTCGNAIYLEGVTNRFVLKAQHTLQGTSQLITVQGNQVMDLGEGKYSFSFTVIDRGTYTVGVYYANVDGGTPELINEGQPLTIDVRPAALSTTKSIHYHGVFADGFDNLGSTDGVYCVATSPTGKLLTVDGQNVFKFFHAAASPVTFDKFYNTIPVDSSIACVRRGALQNLNKQGDTYSNFASKLKLNAANGAIPNASFYFVGKKGGQIATTLMSESLEKALPFAHAVGRAATSTLDGVSFIVASAGANRGNYMFLQVITDPFRTHINASNPLSVLVIDLYGNYLDASEDDILYTVSPAAAIKSEDCEVSSTAFYSCPWISDTTGIYTVTVSAGGSMIRTDSSIYVMSGPAHHATSIAASLPKTLSAGTSTSFFLLLRDAGDQQIIVNNPDDKIEVSFVLPKGGAAGKDLVIPLDATLWVDATRSREVTTPNPPTLAGVYNIVILINGVQHTSTTSATVTVVAGAVDPTKSIVYGNKFDDITVPVEATLTVSFVNRAYIQTFDKYNNIKLSQDSGATIVFTSSVPLDIPAKISYENGGRYYVDFVVTKTSSHTFTFAYKTQTGSPVNMSIRVVDPANASGTLIKPTYVVTKITPGPIHSSSTFKIAGAPLTPSKRVVAAEPLKIQLTMVDAYGNLRVNLDDASTSLLVKYTGVSYLGRLVTGTATWGKCNAATAVCELTLVAEQITSLVADEMMYKLTVVIRTNGNSLLDFTVGEESVNYWSVDVAPAALSVPHTEVTEIPTFLVSRSENRSTVTVKDKYSNRLRTCDTDVKVNVTPLDLSERTACVCDPASPGQFVCVFEVPDFTSGNNNYETNIYVSGTKVKALPFEVSEDATTFYSVVLNPHPSPRIGIDTFQFKIVPTAIDHNAEKPVGVSGTITAKLVLSNDVTSSSFIYLPGKLNEDLSWSFEHTIGAISDYIIVPTRSGAEETVPEPNAAARRGTFQPGLFSPPASSFEDKPVVYVAGESIVWEVIPSDFSGNKFSQCLPDVVADVRYLVADKVVPVPGSACACVPVGAKAYVTLKCTFKMSTTGRHDVYVVGGENSSSLPSEEKYFVTSTYQSITVNNAAPSPATSKIALDPSGTRFPTYSFEEDPSTKRMTEYNDVFVVYVILFDALGNQAVFKDYSADIKVILMDDTVVNTSELNTHSILRDGNTNAYRVLMYFKESHAISPLSILFNIGATRINDKVDIDGGFKTLITSGPASSAAFTLTSGKLTVDYDLTYDLVIKDVHGLPWARDLSNPETDVLKIQLSWSKPSKIGEEFGVASSIPGSYFTGKYKISFSNSQLTEAGDYGVALDVDFVSVTTITGMGADGIIHIAPGLPNLLNSVIVSKPSENMISGRSYTISFYLQDKKSNRLSAQEPMDLHIANIDSSMPCPKDEHLADWNSFATTRGLSIITTNEYDASLKTVLYTMQVSPTYAGKFTIGVFGKDVSKFSPDLNVTLTNQSVPFVFSCIFNSQLFYSVVPGPASASQSIVRFVSPTTESNPTLVTMTNVEMNVQLKDVVGQNIVTGRYRVVLGNVNNAENKDMLHEPKECPEDKCRKPVSKLRIDNTFASQGLFIINYQIYDVNADQYGKALPYKVGVTMLTYASDAAAQIGGDNYTNAVFISGGNSSSMTLTTIPSTPLKLEMRPSVINFVAGQQATIFLYPLDAYGNPVPVTPEEIKNGVLSASVQIVREGSNLDSSVEPNPINIGFYSFYANMGLVLENSDHSQSGDFSASFTPFWEGKYTLSYRLYIAKSSSPVYTSSFPFTVAHEKCAIRDSAKPIFCADGTCVAKVADCKATVCPAETPIVCHDSSCAKTADACPCPADTVRCGTSGKCIAAALCGSLTCPNGTTACPGMEGQCRADVANCPSPVVCPPTYVLCANEAVCVATLTECPAAPTPTTCKGFVCPTGACVSDMSDCPTPVTCPVGKVYCLTSRSCEVSADKCGPQIACPKDHIRCPSGACAVDVAHCPSEITCPVGYVKCDNNACAATAAQCLSGKACSATEIRCNDGTCVQNSQFCPSTFTCPENASIMCSDRSCVTTISECAAISTCPVGSQVCPDGTCVSGTPCPQVKACPIDAPVLCTDRSCVTSRDKCQQPIVCTAALPVRCPTGDCRANIIDCPSQISCDSNKPFRCADNSCAQAPNMCSSESSKTETGIPGETQQPVTSTCPAGKITCPGGECADALLLCPTHVTCPLGSIKCRDGRCAKESECPSVDDQTDCGTLLVCPIATSGVSCAKSLDECPIGVVCPADAPVKCLDSSCAVSLSACPPVPNSTEPVKRNPCPDGSWSVSACPTAVTCPPKFAPYKCYDQSCRADPSDCPVAPKCGNSTPYLCPTGACVSLPWDCTTPVDGYCPFDKPVKCPVFNGTPSCVTDISKCKDVFSDDPEGDREYCIGGSVQCHDGTCKQRSADCAYPKCPNAFPFLCPDGMCAKKDNQCNKQNGCPFDKPVKCSNGTCVSRSIECAIALCPDGSSPCSDGSCRFCGEVTAAGCSVGQVRCYDGSCVESYASCVSNVTTMNACPGNRPFRCDNGLCVTTSSKCPILDPSASICTSSGKPVLCADGSCQATGELCRVIKPCDKLNHVRCGDGTCRAQGLGSPTENCPLLNTCPAKASFRCPNGPCAVDASSCYDDEGCPMVAGRKQSKCPSGLCVTDTALCGATPLSNGCTADASVKCWDGSCVALQSSCPVSNGCPSANPLRCASGRCVAALSECTEDDKVCADGKVTCPDGDCVASASECHTTFGCPVTAPIRCADGTCAKLPATFRDPRYKLSNADLLQTCPTTVICPSKNFVRCADGSCASSYSHCHALNNVCTSSDKPILCSDNKTCVSDLRLCTSSSCPASSPVICPDGGCVASSLDCATRYNPQTSTITGSSTVAKCSASQITCFDGSCADSYLRCMKNSIAIDEDALKKDPEYKGCTVRCPDGTCLPVNDVSLCSPLRRCPVGQYRCANGSCAASKATCDDIDASCGEHMERGVDGVCRAFGKNPLFDGCHWNSSSNYQCANGECASGPTVCVSAAYRNADNWAKTVYADALAYKKAYDAAQKSGQTLPLVVFPFDSAKLSLSVEANEEPEILEANTVQPLACESNCYSQMKTKQTSFAYSPNLSITQSLSNVNAHLTVTIPTGLEVSNSAGTNAELPRFYFSEVAESQVFNATNRVHYSRVAGSEDYPATLTFAQTVLSPIVSCFSDSGIQQPYASRVILSSNIYRHQGLSYNDVCLARLRRFPDAAYNTWECVYDYAVRKTNTVKSDSSVLPDLVTSSLEYCNDPDVPGEFAIYAFILNPLPSRQVYTQSLDTWFRDNMIWALLILCGALCLIALGLYVIQRFSRFKGKTELIKDDVARMELEVDEMEQFGGKAGTKDEEIVLKQNPLAVQLADMQKLTDEDHLRLQQEKLAQQQAESAERANLIAQLEEESARNIAALEVMKTQLQQSAQPHRVDNGGGAVLTMASPQAASAPMPAPQAAPQAQVAPVATATAPSAPSAPKESMPKPPKKKNMDM